MALAAPVRNRLAISSKSRLEVEEAESEDDDDFRLNYRQLLANTVPQAFYEWLKRITVHLTWHKEAVRVKLRGIPPVCFIAVHGGGENCDCR